MLTSVLPGWPFSHLLGSFFLLRYPCLSDDKCHLVWISLPAVKWENFATKGIQKTSGLSLDSTIATKELAGGWASMCQELANAGKTFGSLFTHHTGGAELTERGERHSNLALLTQNDRTGYHSLFFRSYISCMCACKARQYFAPEIHFWPLTNPYHSFLPGQPVSWLNSGNSVFPWAGCVRTPGAVQSRATSPFTGFCWSHPSTIICIYLFLP